MLHQLRVALLLCIGSACRAAPAPPTPSPPAVPSTAASLEEEIAAHAVTDDNYGRRVFYTWTTPQSIATLRKTKRLLVADAQTGGRPSPYTRLVEKLAEHDPVVALLRDDARLTKRRYAWTSPFATVLGAGPRSYGNALVAVSLRDDALIGRLDPTSDPVIRFVDLAGKSVELEDPGRIGAIFHVSAGGATPIRFREYVLCNEAMVQQWSVGTASIGERVAREIELVERLTGPFAQLPPAQTKWRAERAWAQPLQRPNLVTRWHSALAFDNVRYRPTPANLAAIATALRNYDAAGPPLVVSTSQARR